MDLPSAIPRTYGDGLVGFLRDRVSLGTARFAVSLPYVIPVERTAVRVAADLLRSASAAVGSGDVLSWTYWASGPRSGVTTFLALLEAAVQRDPGVLARTLPRRACQQTDYSVWTELVARKFVCTGTVAGPVVLALLFDGRLSNDHLEGLQRQWEAFVGSKAGRWPGGFVAVAVSLSTSLNGRTFTIPAFLKPVEVDLFEAAFVSVAEAWDAHSTPLDSLTRVDAIRSVAARAAGGTATFGTLLWLSSTRPELTRTLLPMNLISLATSPLAPPWIWR